MDAIDGRWRIFTKDPGLLDAEVNELWKQGFAAAPSNYLGEAQINKEAAQAL